MDLRKTQVSGSGVRSLIAAIGSKTGLSNHQVGRRTAGERIGVSPAQHAAVVGIRYVDVVGRDAGVDCRRFGEVECVARYAAVLGGIVHEVRLSEDTVSDSVAEVSVVFICSRKTKANA